MSTYPSSIPGREQSERRIWAEATVRNCLIGSRNGIPTILPKAEQPEHQPATSGPLKRPDGTIASSSNTASSLPNASTGNARWNSMYESTLRRCQGRSTDAMRKTLSMYNSSSAPMPSWWPSNLETLSRKGNYHNLDTFSRSLQLTELAHTVACLILHRNAQVGSAKVRHKQAPSSNCNQEAKLDTRSQSWPTTDESLQSPEENPQATTNIGEHIAISNEQPRSKYGRSFNISDSEELQMFYRDRLDEIPKETLSKVMNSWKAKLREWHEDTLSLYDPATSKDSEYHASLI
jgi:hypothetical protein